MNRKIFSRIPSVMNIPNLIEIQRNSFGKFLQLNVPPDKRKNEGLQLAFLDIFPISNIDQTLSLEFVDYTLEQSRYTEEECIEKDDTYAMSLKIKVKLNIQRKTKGNPVIKEQELYLCNLPCMTTTGTFIINGAERVIVNQLHRSPGIIFEEDDEPGTEKIKISMLGKKLYISSIIPYRGAWVEFGFDTNNILFVKIDKKRRMFVTTFLRAMGLESDEHILNLFYATKTVKVDRSRKRNAELSGEILAKNAVAKGTKEVIAEANAQVGPELIEKLVKNNVAEITVIDRKSPDYNPTIHMTLKKDNVKTQTQAILEIFKRLRAQEFISEESAKNFFEILLFKTTRRYDLCEVGRYKINKKETPILEEMNKSLPADVRRAVINSSYYAGNKEGSTLEIPPVNRRTLCVQDIIATIKYLMNLNNDTEGYQVDDIDHLGNRRVRSVGELLENQIRIGLSHMARLTREKMNIQSIETITPRDIINTAPVVGVIRKFFGTSQLSQFMDQINPLAELTHKRRLSALGPGGLNRKRAGFKVRDVHYSHYGRICPIETPEGPNIGLITTLSIYAKVNKYGLIETPYRKVRRGRVTDEIEYLTADKEEECIIAQADARIDGNGAFKDEMVMTRCRGDISAVKSEEIDYMEVSPMQLVGPSAGLIPFLEHDDANRALMGSNMQRQAVPLLINEKPLVLTGIEGIVACDSRVVVTARASGRVISVSADKIIVVRDEREETAADIYELKKYRRSNQDTCINQVPIVDAGSHVKKGQVIADGPCTDHGELALGKNLLVAFMPWAGYNFEDAILVSERLVKEDIFTSVHIQEFQVGARDLTIGSEEITRDIPNVGEDVLRNLNENGIIRVGAHVKQGDILVGKVTPKGETRATPEERLLKVIFGKKAEEVQDASLRVPPGVEGKVLDVQVFTRKEKTNIAQERQALKKIDDKYTSLVGEARNAKKKRLLELQSRHRGKSVAKDEAEIIERLCEVEIEELKKKKRKEQNAFRYGDELPVTVNKLVKVFIVTKRKIAVGDKLSGRHGNKGVVSRILPVEDMPYLADGTHVDVVLNPLSVPSRMNVGQILEVQLGWAANREGLNMVCPVFDGADEDAIKGELKRARLPEDSRATLYDGRTGEQFKEKITVGCMYLMKLAHLVEDKMHARSIGPYSLITRQPLGGKTQFGGQRFGEMEVWAVEGYGAAYTLQEFLTMKSDDVVGRTKMYENIVKGELMEETGVPESFGVLVKELRSLCMNVHLHKK